jgi:iron complex transport system ATP-binding protein
VTRPNPNANASNASNASVPLLEAKSVDFAYYSGSPVVVGVSMAVRRGTLSAVIGANGSGKSTLVRLLAGLLTPTRGEIAFDGAPLASFDRRGLARRIAYVPQTNAAVFPFTALEVVLTGRSPHIPRMRFEGDDDRRKALEALETVEAAHLASRPVTELSGGERQLVAVARALAQEPECLLLDEPSASLDAKHRGGLTRVLRAESLERVLTALVVTHDLQLLDPGFDYVFAIRCGAVVAEGTPPEVLRDSVLAEVYDDATIRTRRVEGRTFVWSET